MSHLSHCMRCLWLVCLALCWACSKSPRTIEIEFDLPLSGVSKVEIVNAKNGTRLSLDSITDGKGILTIDSVFPMVYLLQVSWERALLNHHEMRMMMKYDASGATYQLKHYLYLSPREQEQYSIRLNKEASQNDLELAYQNNAPEYRLVVHEPTGKNVALQEEVEALYYQARVDFYRQKDSLTQLMYGYADAMEQEKVLATREQIGSLWQDQMLPRLTQAQNAFIAAHPDSPASACLLYSRVMNLDDFIAHRHLYDMLTPAAMNNHFGHELRHYEQKLQQQNTDTK